MPAVFISYRRDDSWDATWRIYDHLQRHFSADEIFIDVDNIPPGEDFRTYIHKSLQGCRVMLVVMGEQWLNAVDQAGRRRLDQSDDFVRLELEWAMENGVEIIPVLIRKATMPAVEHLPTKLAQFAFINAATVRSSSEFLHDVERLIGALRTKGVMPTGSTASPQTERENPGTCQKCGRQNEMHRKRCGRCGEPLRECCIGCGFENGTWDIFCGQCGENVARLQRTRIEELNEAQSRITARRQESRYQEAISEMEKIAAVSHPRLKTYSEWAAQLLPTLRSEWTEAQQRRMQLTADAQRLLGERRFMEAADTLQKIPPALRTRDDDQLLSLTQEKARKIEDLCAAVEREVLARNLAKVWSYGGALFAIEPDAEFVRGHIQAAFDLTLRVANSNFAAHRYGPVIKSIEFVPKELRDEAMNQLHNEALKKQEQAETLAAKIREARRTGATHELFGLLPQFLELKPEHKEGRMLLDLSLRKATNAVRRAWDKRQRPKATMQLIGMIPSALRTEEIERAVRELRDMDPEFRDGRLGELLDRTLKLSQTLTDERKFQQAMQVVEELPETPAELGHIKYMLLMQVNEAQQLEESCHRVAKLTEEGQFAMARAVAHDLPDASDEVRTRKAGLLRQVDEFEQYALGVQRVEQAIKQAQELVSKRDFREAKNVILGLPDEPHAVGELKQMTLTQIEEAEASAKRMGMLDKANGWMKKGRHSDALQLLNQVLNQNPQDVNGIYLRAGCLVLLDRLADAEQDLNRLRQLAPTSPDAEAAVADLEEYLASRSVAARLDEAAELMKKDSFAEALPLLNQAVAAAPRDRNSLYLLCTASIYLWCLREARSVLSRFKELAVSSPEAQAAADRLGEELATVERLVLEYGRREIFELRNQAVTAFNEDRHEDAVRLLRRALSDHGGNTSKLREELSMVLTATAVAALNSAKPKQITETLNYAISTLKEAADLDPKNEQARQALAHLGRR